MDILRASREDLRRDFGVESLALFGSAARGDAGPQSDIDVLVDVPERSRFSNSSPFSCDCRRS